MREDAYGGQHDSTGEGYEVTLANEGLLTHRPYQGYFVTKMNQEHIVQIHALLEFLETEIVRTLAWPDEVGIAELRRINTSFREVARRGDIKTVDKLNRELHASIFGLANQDVFLTEAGRLWSLAEPYRLLHVANADTDVAAAQHDQIIDALARSRPGSVSPPLRRAPSRDPTDRTVDSPEHEPSSHRRHQLKLLSCELFARDVPWPDFRLAILTTNTGDQKFRFV